MSRHSLHLIASAARSVFYEGNDPDPNAQPNTPPPTNEVALNPATGKPYTKSEFQAEINKQQAAERKKHQDKQKDMITELERLKGLSSTSEEDKTRLQSQIDQLTSELQTKEEQQKAASQKLQEKYERDTGSLKTERDSWKSRFEDTLFTNDVARHAGSDAFDLEQVDAILRPRRKTVEELGPDGKPTGNYISKVMFPAKDKDNKSIVLELTVAEAVKMMKEMPDKYGNLFKSTAKAGFGGSNQSVNPQNLDVENMSDADYEKHRLTILANAKPRGA